MIRRNKQLFRHEPWNGIFGDCHRTAISCLLGLAPHEVPHFIQQEMESDGYWRELQNSWLAERGFVLLTSYYAGEGLSLTKLLSVLEGCNGSQPAILGGRSPRGTDHSVVYLGRGAIWDPSEFGGGLVGPLSNGFWEVNYLGVRLQA